MTAFEKTINSVLEQIGGETTITPVKPTTPTKPASPRTTPNPFRRPGHQPFVQPRPKAKGDDAGDKMVQFFAKRLNRINSTFDKYAKLRN
jgi:hypothetical protein